MITLTEKTRVLFALLGAFGASKALVACNPPSPYKGSLRDTQAPPKGTSSPQVGAGKVERPQASINNKSNPQPLPKLGETQTQQTENPIPNIVVGIIQGALSRVPNNPQIPQTNNPPSAQPPSQPSTQPMEQAPPPANRTVEDSVPQATCPMYANTKAQLFCVRPTGPELVATFRLNGAVFSTVTDIAISLTGRIYAISPSALYLVDPTNANLVLVRNINVGEANALTVLSDGRLIVAGRGVAVLDLEKNQLQTIAATTSYSSSGDIVGLPDKKLYWTVSSASGDQLVVVDVFAGTARLLGRVGQQNVLGLAYANGQLYGFSDSGKMFTISQQTGAAGAVIHSDSTRWWGATTNPVKW